MGGAGGGRGGAPGGAGGRGAQRGLLISASFAAFDFFKLIGPHCFKHRDRIQQTNLRPGNETSGFRYWIENKCQA